MASHSPRRIAIGDIHGCSYALDAVLDAIDPQPDDFVICLGDMIDTGRETKAVLDRLIRLSAETNLITILGNHEEVFLAAIENPRLLETWWNCGGVATINSYRFCGTIDDIDSQHIDFIRGCRDFYETDHHILVHANYDPDASMDSLPSHTLRWQLLDEFQPRPHDSGKTVIVGHTEQKNGEILDLGPVICIDTYCHGSGWLTALDLDSGQVWQASRWGALREGDEDVQRIQNLARSIRTSGQLEEMPR